MRKQRETYIATTGVENDGYDFEDIMLSYYCYNLCYNKSVNDFKIAIYNKEYHPFDDIVIDITTKITEKYAIQLKHVRDKLQLKPSHFGKNGKMPLVKYFNFDFTKCEQVVLLTNGVVNEEIQLSEYQMVPKMEITEVDTFLNTSVHSQNQIYDITSADSSNRIAFFHSQRNKNEVHEALTKDLKEKFHLTEEAAENVVQKLILFLQQWKKGFFQACKLDKEDIRMKMVEILFFDSIITVEPRFYQCIDKKIALLQKVLNKNTVTLIEDLENDLISHLCQFDDDINDIIKEDNFFLITDNIKKLALILWRMRKFPLIVKIENFEMVQAIVNDVHEDNLSFIFISNFVQRDFNNLSIFQNLSNLEKKDFDLVSDQFKLSIQGQEAIELKTLIKWNEKIAQSVTLKELVLMSKEDFVIGGFDWKVPEPYISRRLISSLLKIDDLNYFPKDLFIINKFSKTLQEKLPKHKIWSYKDFVKNMFLKDFLPSKLILICEDKSIFDKLDFKYKNNVHWMKMIDDDTLQLMYSKRKTDQFKPYQTLQEEELFTKFSNKINLICGSPGMGKQTLIKYLRKNCSFGYWTINAHLDEVENEFQTSFSFESQVLRHLREANRVIVFLSGIDNLEKDRLLQAIEQVKKLSKGGCKVCLFAEEQLQETLEENFEIPALILEGANEVEQFQYIRKKCLDQNMNTNQLKKILASFKSLNSDQILQAPVHLHMLSEFLLHNFPTNQDVLLTDIYEFFIQNIYQRYFKKVCQHNSLIIHDWIHYRNEQYKLAALSRLDPMYFLNINIKNDKYFLDQIRENGDVLGIISNISNKCVTFDQEILADYFAALWLVDNYKIIKDSQKMINQKEFRNLILYSFIICKGHPAHIAVLCQNVDQLLQLKHLWNTLDPIRRTPLHVAISNYINNSKELFSTKTEDITNQKILYYLLKERFDLFQKAGIFNWDCYDYAFNYQNFYAIDRMLHVRPETFEIVLNKLQNFQDLYTFIFYAIKFSYLNLLKLLSKTERFLSILKKHEDLLYLAVKSGCYDTVDILLNCGADVNKIADTINGRSVLHEAIEQNNFYITKLLLKRGARINVVDKDYRTPLHLASLKDYCILVELLINHSANINLADTFGQTPLFLAVSKKHKNVIQLLLQKGACVNHKDRLGNTLFDFLNDRDHEILGMISIRCNQKKRSSLDQFDEYTSHQLHWAAFTGEEKRIKDLLYSNENINEEDNLGRTSLYIAVARGNLNVAKILLHQKASINAADYDNVVPLCRAIRNEDFQMMTLILQRNPSIDIQDSFGYTPLHWAVMTKNEEIVEMLLLSNPDIDILDSFGRKPVNCAIENGSCEIVRLLSNDDTLMEAAKMKFNFHEHYSKNDSSSLHKAAYSGTIDTTHDLLESDLNVLDQFGYNPLMLAAMNGHDIILEFILKSGGSTNVDSCGNGPLELASKNGHVKSVQVLLENKIFDRETKNEFLTLAAKQNMFLKINKLVS